ELLAGLPLEIGSLQDFPDFPGTVEDQPDFQGNAAKKALEAAAFTGCWALADDSGLEVDYLNGLPGVYSARYAGDGHDDAANNAKLLTALQGVPLDRRTARFRCVMVLAAPGRILIQTEGKCEGLIGQALRGEQGFGYDPLFIYPPDGQTFAELGLEIKNKISHRAKALQAMAEELARWLKSEDGNA
ncbi:MAG: RdgB/HAM1 family non-canonical purine NTP pyrophosphatase, partial [Clostridia bacterium]|nr:RdgB/HAM1 family non-canonical purine NTP pyrophosphatase [Clostridia bacterium]